MKRSGWFGEDIRECEVIATFGDAQLVKTRAGKLELRGGSPEDRQEA